MSEDTVESLKARLVNLQTRYDKLREENTAAQNSIKGIAKERDQYKAAAAGVEAQEAALEKLRGELEATKKQSAIDVAMASAGLKKPSRQRFARSEYAAHVEEAGDKALDFNAWLEREASSEDSEIAAWLAPADGAKPAAEPATAQPANGHRTEGGVKPPPSPPSPYSPGSIASMSREEWAAQKESLLQGVKVFG